MLDKRVTKYAALDAIGIALYIVLVVTFLSNAQYIFGSGEDSALIPVVMLLLFVTSATITSLLMFGRPILWYLDGKKKEAVALVAATLGMMVVLTLIAAVVLFFYSRI